MKLRVPRHTIKRSSCRYTHTDSRQRLSDFWIPTINVQKQDATSDATQLLIRAGYLRQAYAGIFQLLPLGLRVQEKLERLIDKHMRSVKASKVSLSSISSQALWEKSGRFKTGGEMFTFKDRKETKWLLAPTHEEEITNLVASVVQTRQQLPIRLYQIGRKYRDEKRPRGGLLRGREFLMKDLYTFDSTPEEAHVTYDEIRNAYRSFLNELKIKYVEARATSGDMGGNLSHEYHFPNFAGEDIVITCSDCDYARNEEFVSQRPYTPISHSVQDLIAGNETQHTPSETQALIHEDFLSADHQSLIRAISAVNPGRPSSSINPYAVKAVLNGTLEIDSGVEDPLQQFEKISGSSPSNKSIYYLLDSSLPGSSVPRDLIFQAGDDKTDHYIIRAPSTGEGKIHLLKHEAGDPCPQCETGTLRLDKAIEIGHTFHLGTRYSAKLDLTTKQEGKKDAVPVEMGCHGIGVSRLIAATASCLSDDLGLNWPRAIAPFEAIIVVAQSQKERLDAAEKLYDQLSTSKSSDNAAVDVILDDRTGQGMGWKLKDADMIGYPVIVVFGKAFDQGKVEVQCRRLKVKQDVEIDAAAEFVSGLLKQL